MAASELKKKSTLFYDDILTSLKILLLSPVDSNPVHGKTATKTHFYMHCLSKNLNLIFCYIYYWNLCVDIMFKVSAEITFIIFY